MPGIDDLNSGGPAGISPSIFGVGVPALRDPLDQGATALAPPAPVLTGPGLSWLLFGGAPFGAAAFAVRGPDMLAVPRLVSLRLTTAPAASVVVLRPTADPVGTVDTPPRPLVVQVLAATSRALPATLLDSAAEPSDVRPPAVLVAAVRGPAAAPIPVTLRLTADPATTPDVLPRLLTARPATAAPYLTRPSLTSTEPPPRTPFLPSDLLGLAMWLDAPALGLSGGAAVSAWTDRSGNGRTPTQASGPAQPVITEAAINGLSCVTFSGAQALTFASSIPTTAGFTAFVVTRITAATNAYVLFNGNGNGYALGTDGTGTKRELLLRGVADVVGGTYTVGAADMWAGQGDNVVGSVLYDLGAVETTSGNGPASASGGLVIGAWETGTASYLNGHVGEVIAYDRVLSPGERALVTQYLADRWFLPNNGPAVTETLAPTVIAPRLPPSQRSTLVPVTVRSTADPTTAPTPTRSLVVQVLTPLAAAARAFVTSLLADQPAAPTTAVPAPLRVTPAAPLLAAPVPVLLHSTADPMVNTDTLPRTVVVPLTTSPAAAPRVALSASLAEQVAMDAPRQPVAVVVTSRQWAPVPVLVRQVADPAAPDSAPRLVIVGVPGQLTPVRPVVLAPSSTGPTDTLPLPIVVRVATNPATSPTTVLVRTPFAVDPAVRLRALVVRAGQVTYPVTVALIRSTYGDPPPQSLTGRITEGRPRAVVPTLTSAAPTGTQLTEGRTAATPSLTAAPPTGSRLTEGRPRQAAPTVTEG